MNVERTNANEVLGQPKLTVAVLIRVCAFFCVFVWISNVALALIVPSNQCSWYLCSHCKFQEVLWSIVRFAYFRKRLKYIYALMFSRAAGSISNILSTIKFAIYRKLNCILIEEEVLNFDRLNCFNWNVCKKIEWIPIFFHQTEAKKASNGAVELMVKTFPNDCIWMEKNREREINFLHR